MALCRHQFIHLLVLHHRVSLSVVAAHTVPGLVRQVQLHLGRCPRRRNSGTEDLSFALLFMPNPIGPAGHGVYSLLCRIRSLWGLSFVPAMVRAFIFKIPTSYY